MTFIHPLLLGGLLLAGLPVLLHLIMQQKPKQLPFPAFRFLVQRHRTNQRRLRLRHLLLLALRVLLVALVCLALARPKLFSEKFGFGGQQPVNAVLLFDTSFSMEYVSGGRSRLEEARSRALELIQEFPEGSRVAVLDSTVDPAEPSGEWLALGPARERIEALRPRPNNGPVTARLGDAYRLLADLEREQGDGEQGMPRFLYVFSDRTDGAWDTGRSKDLLALRERLGEGVSTTFIDVGAENAANLALVEVRPRRQVIAAGQPLVVEATVRAVGADFTNLVKCRIGDAVDQKEVTLAAGQSQVVTFERAGLVAGFHRIEVTLGTADALAFDNARFATAEVRGGRQVLIVADNPDEATFFQLALEVAQGFQCKVIRTAELDRLDDATPYQVLCLFQVADPSPALWAAVERHLGKGGGVLVVPAGAELSHAAYNEGPARKLLPGEIRKLVTRSREEGGADWNWEASIYRHPLLKQYQEDRLKESTDFVRHPRGATAYWDVAPHPDGGSALVTYADAEKRPAILERAFPATRGRLVLLTTKLDGQWNDYLDSITTFYVALARRTCGYLAGYTEETNLNFFSGQMAMVSLPPQARLPNSFTLQGPSLTGTQAVIHRREGQSELEAPQAVTPGTYAVAGEKGQQVGQFSVNIPPEESLLIRTAIEPIEELFGPGAVVPLDRATNLREVLQNRWGHPVELLPWLMMMVLLALAVENLLANKFYRASAAQTPPPA